MDRSEDVKLSLRKDLKKAIGAEIKNVEIVYSDIGIFQKIGSVKVIFPKPEEVENNGEM